LNLTPELSGELNEESQKIKMNSIILRMPMEERLFSIEEANRLLPVLAPILMELSRDWIFMQRINDEIRRAHEAADRGGGSVFGTSYIESAEGVVHFLHRIQEMGVLLKDPGSGLCDFAHQIGERVIYLCWKLGEEEISWWHEAETGFAGRRPLSELE
jgi:hypothetical protein